MCVHGRMVRLFFFGVKAGEQCKHTVLSCEPRSPPSFFIGAPGTHHRPLSLSCLYRGVVKLSLSLLLHRGKRMASLVTKKKTNKKADWFSLFFFFRRFWIGKESNHHTTRMSFREKERNIVLDREWECVDVDYVKNKKRSFGMFSSSSKRHKTDITHGLL